VVIDEFAAIAPTHVARLFAASRTAGMSLVLGTQEHADLEPADNPALADQVQGNMAALIAHRQTVPQSAERVAEIAGTRAA